MKTYLLLLIGLLPFCINAQFRCQDIKQHMLQTAANEPSLNNNPKSDTIDILHYKLELDLYNIHTRTLKGLTEITFTPKVNNVSSICLDLLKLNIDSVYINHQTQNYHYNDTILKVNFGLSYNIGDTVQLYVKYQGTPQVDASGWGGLHTQNGYYFNLGVGFAANPHTYGRIFFPCFDNFVEKSTYSFDVITQQPNKAYCNGIRTLQENIGNDTSHSQWEMSDEIPTYLVSFAVSNYAEIIDSIAAQNGILPIWLMTRAQDTNKIKNSFINLKPTIHAFETAFGAYRWQKVGYAATTIGAMEHATSIHYPINLINGGLDGEDIMAHELAHHWWGNLVTCATAEDMWINEGLAEYSSHLYLEDVYSRKRYINAVRDNGYKVLNTAHNQDNGYRALYGVPHDFTYGFHVYQKGAMIGHNLRAYLGDNKFFSGLKNLLHQHAYSNISSETFKNDLSQITGVSLDPFFDGWIFNKGYPSFSIDSFYANNTNDVNISIVQNLHHAPNYFNQVPVEVTFFSSNGDTTTRTIICNGAITHTNFSDLNFKPVFALISYSGKLLTADTYDEHNITINGTYNPKYSQLRLTANNVSDSIKIWTEYHWAGPSKDIPSQSDYIIANDRFWTIQSNTLDKGNISARFIYNKNNTDSSLFKGANNNEDSLAIFYRAQPQDNWTPYPYQVKTMGNITDGNGYIDVGNLKSGDYVFGKTNETIGIKEIQKNIENIHIYPNPTKGTIYIEFEDNEPKAYNIEIFDTTGKSIYQKKIRKSHWQNNKSIELPNTSSQQISIQIDNKIYKLNYIAK